MATQFEIDCAVMAGRSYISNRPDENKFPVPQDWIIRDDLYRKDDSSGFEAVSFQKGNEIVISFAGTDPKDLWGDILADSWDLLVGGRCGRKNPLTLCVAIG
jgi:hypothetical protein